MQRSLKFLGALVLLFVLSTAFAAVEKHDYYWIRLMDLNDPNYWTKYDVVKDNLSWASNPANMSRIMVYVKETIYTGLDATSRWQYWGYSQLLVGKLYEYSITNWNIQYPDPSGNPQPAPILSFSAELSNTTSWGVAPNKSAYWEKVTQLGGQTLSHPMWQAKSGVALGPVWPYGTAGNVRTNIDELWAISTASNASPSLSVGIQPPGVQGGPPGGSVFITAIPEPSSVIAVLAGLGALIGMRKRK